MSEHLETRERRHTRYLRYAAEARELAARTTDSVKEHHVRVALAWEAMARKLVPYLPDPKPKLLQSIDATVHNESQAADGPRLGHRTEAVRGRLAERFTRARHRAQPDQDFEP